MKKLMPVKNKVVLCFSAIIVIILLTQLIFNMFFIMPFVSAVKIGTINYSFEEFKNEYAGEDTNIEEYAQELLEKRGIRLAVKQNDKDIYYPHIIDKDKPPLPNDANINRKRDPMHDNVFDKSQFSTTPKAVIEGDDNDQWIMLRGCFDYSGETVYVTMSFYMPTIESRVSFYEYINVSIMIVALFIAIIPAFIFSRSLTKPITEIEHVAKNVSNLDFSYSANENITSEELANLAKSINIMSNNLQTSIKELQIANERLQDDIDYKNKMEDMQRLFIANVSHEMKTPLGILQLYCENLKNNIEGIDKDYYYDVIISETQKLNRMVARMLDISSIEAGAINMNFDRFNLSEMCLSQIEKVKNIYENRHIEYDIEPDAYINGDINYVEKALANYINNALTYATEDSKIALTLKKFDSTVRVSVFNEAEPISEENIELIWTPFYRFERARTRTDNNNVGLGLSIVKSIIEKHNGTVELENKSNGVEFSFTLPIE